MYRVSPFITAFAWALLGGIAVATVWVNFSPATYYDLVELRVADVTLPRWMGAKTVICKSNTRKAA